MKLSNETLNVLSNFASMNPNIEFKKGKTIKTLSSTKAVLAKATVQDDFPQDFCIHDLNQFLMTYSSSKDTEINFDDKNVLFKLSPRMSVKYRMSEKTVLLTPPDKELKPRSIRLIFVKLPIVLGIEPFNWLLLMSSSVRFFKSPIWLGNGPDIEF